MLNPSSSEEEEDEVPQEEENHSDALSLPSADQKSLQSSQSNLSSSGGHGHHHGHQQYGGHPQHRQNHGGYGHSPHRGRDVPHTHPGTRQNAHYRDEVDHDHHDPRHHGHGHGHHGHDRHGGRRPPSPSPSQQSERERERQYQAELERAEREEEERKRKLQLYVLVLRCIAYPFNAKQPTDMARRQAKVSKQQLQTIKDRFASFINGETNIVADEAFTNAVQSYYEVFLKSDRVANMVRSGGCSANDFREVFKNNIEKRVRSLPEIDGLSKETVLSSWMTKFDQIFRGEEDPRKQSQRMSTGGSELILSKEQLYEMFQNILGVKKYEHQILYNACQVRICLNYGNE